MSSCLVFKVYFRIHQLYYILYREPHSRHHPFLQHILDFIYYISSFSVQIEIQLEHPINKWKEKFKLQIEILITSFLRPAFAQCVRVHLYSLLDGSVLAFNTGFKHARVANDEEAGGTDQPEEGADRGGDVEEGEANDEEACVEVFLGDGMVAKLCRLGSWRNT